MKITRAIPERLNKSYLSDAEREELKKYGDQPLSQEEIDARELEEQQAVINRQEAQAKAARKQILEALDEIDRKSIRAIRAGENDRLQQLEQEAAALRATLQ